MANPSGENPSSGPDFSQLNLELERQNLIRSIISAVTNFPSSPKFNIGPIEKRSGSESLIFTAYQPNTTNILRIIVSTSRSRVNAQPFSQSEHLTVSFENAAGTKLGKELEISLRLESMQTTIYSEVTKILSRLPAQT
jgi:hypothetical protein